jgi:hypothetical protein
MGISLSFSSFLTEGPLKYSLLIWVTTPPTDFYFHPTTIMMMG